MVWLALRSVITKDKQLFSCLHGAYRAKMSRLKCTDSQKFMSSFLYSRKPYYFPPIISSLNFHTQMNRNCGNVRTTETICSGPELHFLWNPKGNDRPHNSVTQRAVEIPAHCNEVATKMSCVLHLEEHLPCYLQTSIFSRQIHSFPFLSYRQKSCVTLRINRAG